MSDGWSYNRPYGMHEYRKAGRIVHRVTREAWSDFLAYIETPPGARWARDLGIDNVPTDAVAAVPEAPKEET